MEWELVTSEDYVWTKRLKVDGGYLYRTINQDHNDNLNVAMCFVPDVDLQRYQSHLRDAYTQGYQAGQEDAKHGVSQ